MTHHLIPQNLVDEVFANSAKFFARSRQQKDELAWTTPRANRGYVCLGREKVSQGETKEEVAKIRETAGEDLKESFEIGREGEEGCPNHWLDGEDEEGREFKDVMQEFFLRCQDVHKLVMRGIAMGMGLEEGFFDRYLRNDDNTLRLLHYPGVSKGAFSAGQVRAGAHTDYGSITLLFQDQRGGLQVERPEGGFMDVKPIEGSIVVNAGDLLARWSNDMIRSTKHRVVEPPIKARNAGDVYPPRYSVAYFCNPDFDQWIEALPGTWKESDGPKYKKVNSGEYLMQRLGATF